MPRFDWLFADRNEEINQWLDQHPLVLGLCAIALGAVIGGWGLYELKSGTSYDKKGRKLEGGAGKAARARRRRSSASCSVPRSSCSGFTR